MLLLVYMCSKASYVLTPANWRRCVQSEYTLRVYSDWTRQCQFDGVKHDALVLEHMLNGGVGGVKRFTSSMVLWFTLGVFPLWGLKINSKSNFIPLDLHLGGSKAFLTSGVSLKIRLAQHQKSPNLPFYMRHSLFNITMINDKTNLVLHCSAIVTSQSA